MYLELLAKLFLIIGGINYLFIGLTDGDINIFDYLGNHTIINAIYLIIGLSSLYFILNRDYYLPFLGHTVVPIVSNKNFENVKNIKLSNLPPNVVVLAWGSKESSQIYEDPFKAYGDYENTVISRSDANGNAVVQLPCPSSYYVNKFGILKHKLKRHIHYRYEIPKYKGLFSRVYTKYLDENCL